MHSALTTEEKREAVEILRRACGSLDHMDMDTFFSVLARYKRCALERDAQQKAEEKVWGKGMGVGKPSFEARLAAEDFLLFLRRYMRR
jgi:hypothetical protein